MASSWPTKRLYEQPESATAAVRAITTTEALRTSPVIVVSIDGRPEGRPLPSSRDHSIQFTIRDWTYHPAPPPPPPLRPPPNPPKPPPNPPPPNPPPPNPPPNGPTPLLQPPHPPRRPRRRRRPMIALITMNRTKRVIGPAPPNPGLRCARRSCCLGTPCSVTLRPSAIRPIRRATPACNPGPYRPSANSGAMTWRLVSPANPSVTNCSRSYPTSTCTRRSLTATTTSSPLSLPRWPTPRPPFSNIFAAYSWMVPYGWNDSTVATTTTSPVVSCSDRIIPSIAAALCASMTEAKSLTGLVSCGGAGCAKANVAIDATSASEHTPRRARLRIWRTGLGRPPGVHGARQLLDGGEVCGEQTRRVGLRNRRRPFERE